jgi:hypothetical protein
MYKLLEDLHEAELDDYIPSDEAIEEYLNDYKNYDSPVYSDGEIEKCRMLFNMISGTDESDYDTGNTEELLDMPLSHYLGVTNSQLKFINFDLVFVPDRFENFVSMMNDECYHASNIEDTIKLVTLASYMDDNRFMFQRSDVQSEALSVLKSREFGEALSLMREWFDYCSMYNNMKDVLFGNNSNKHGLDADAMDKFRSEFNTLFSEGKSLKPGHIKDMHDKMVRFSRKVSNIIEEKEAEMKNGLMLEATKSPLYRKFLYSEDKYSIEIIRSYDDLRREGDVLSHCVKSYANDIIDGRCLIYGIRRKNAPETPYFTAEIRRGDDLMSGRGFRLTQCYGYNDTTDKPDSLHDFIMRWTEAKGLRVECEV